MLTIKIQVPIQTKPRPRARVFGKFANVYTPKEAVKYEKLIASEFIRLGGRYFGNDPLAVYIEFHFKLPKNSPKWMQFAAKKNLMRCCIHKDIDNLAKSIFDALNGVAYEDDRQIVYTELSKHWTNEEDYIILDILKMKDKTPEEIKKEYKEWKEINQ